MISVEVSEQFFFLKLSNLSFINFLSTYPCEMMNNSAQSLVDIKIIFQYFVFVVGIIHFASKCSLKYYFIILGFGCCCIFSTVNYAAK